MRVTGEGEPYARAGTLIPSAGTTDPLFEPIVQRVEGATPGEALAAVAGLGGRGAPARQVRTQLLEHFADLGVLARERDRLLGVTWRERWSRGERRDVEDVLQEAMISLMIPTS